MLNLRLSACVPTMLAAMLSLFTSAASIRLVLGIKGLRCCSCGAVTNADYKTPPPKCAQKIGKSSKTRTKAGKVLNNSPTSLRSCTTSAVPFSAVYRALPRAGSRASPPRLSAVRVFSRQVIQWCGFKAADPYS